MRSNLGQGEIFVTAFVVLLVIGGIGGCCAIAPQYGVYQQEMEGKAELAKAEYSKKVAVETARAKKESAQYEADAEVTRAGGVAKANQIIGQSLNGNEAYLKYLWIDTLRDTHDQVIYIPTEANLPILEAGRSRPKSAN